MHIAVTGGTGFIGSQVAAQARRRGHDVRVLTRRSAAGAVAGCEYLQAELQTGAGLDGALRGVDSVVHCAAAMGGDLAAQEAITVGGTRNLLAAMASANVRRLVSLSTFALYDYRALADGALLDESSPLESDFDARAPYVLAKTRQEKLIKSAASQGALEKSVVLRPGLVFGPGRTWFHHLGVQLPGNIWLSLAPASLLPLTHVENCATAIVLAAESTASGNDVLNVVDDDLPDRRQYMAVLASHQRVRPRTLEVPWRALAGMARAATRVNHSMLRGRAPLPDLLRDASLESRCKPLRYDNRRIKETLGWQPQESWRLALDRALASSNAP